MADDLFYRVGIESTGVKYDLSNDLGSLTVEQRASQPSKVTIEMRDPFKVFGHAIQPGMKLDVELGTADAHAIVFAGRIYQVNGTFPERGVPTVTISAYDGTMAMGLKERNRVFTDKTLSKIVKEVAGAPPYQFAGVQVDVKGDPSFPGNGIRQREETDLAFLIRLAAAHGCAMTAAPAKSGELLEFKAERKLIDGDPEVKLYYGRCDVENSLLSFTPSSDIGRVQLPRVLAGVEYESGKAISAGKADSDDVKDLKDPFAHENMAAFTKRYPDRGPKLDALAGTAEATRTTLEQELGTVIRETVPTFTTEKDLAQRRQNQFSTQRLGMEASAVTLGNYRLRAQRTVGVLDVGGQFSGKWFMTQVRHTVNRSGFRTEFECRR
ncbi:MAG TPA: contractile injection system protein, VgrG/Pvc8 family [Gemmatimonadales bacterium]|jgi:phage protein D|nr:contractile injection system protein, VgrG/Pvc8 family [Gemmatimonadales bacterium]